MANYNPILNNELGSSVRVKLNNIGSDNEITFRVVSQYSQIESEINYFETGTVVFATLERKWYKYSGASWIENSDFPTLNYVVIAEIDDLDSPYSITSEQICLCDTSSGNITINLPSVSTEIYIRYKIKNIGSGIVTLDPNTNETIEGDITFDLFESESVEIVSNGLAWYII